MQLTADELVCLNALLNGGVDLTLHRSRRSQDGTTNVLNLDIYTVDGVSLCLGRLLLHLLDSLFNAYDVLREDTR